MNYETCMKYKCKNCPIYLDCERAVNLENDIHLLYKPFENLKEILKARRKNDGEKN